MCIRIRYLFDSGSGDGNIRIRDKHSGSATLKENIIKKTKLWNLENKQTICFDTWKRISLGNCGMKKPCILYSRPIISLCRAQKASYNKNNTCLLGYSDFHNLMGFTSKKMPNNIPKNVCQNVFQLVKPFLANLRCTSSKKYRYLHVNRYVINDPKKPFFLFCMWV